MNFLKNIGGRIGYFLLGVVLTALGALFIYWEFKSNQRVSSGNSSWPSYPFITFALGLGSIIVAFSRNKKAGDTKNTDSTKQRDKS